MNKQYNEALRETIHKSGLYQWQIAEHIGISEFTLCRWLRYELTTEQKEQIMQAIAELSAC